MCNICNGMTGNMGDNRSDELMVIEDNIRNTYGSVVWSHKIQEKQADISIKKYKILETMRVIASSLTSVGIISLLFSNDLWIKIVSALLSFISVGVSAFFKSFDLQKTVSSHKATANKLLKARDELRLLLIKTRLDTSSTKVLLEEYQQLVAEIDAIYAEAPTTSDLAVRKARTALNVTKDNLITDAEIDNNLPQSLRKDYVE